MENHNNLLSDQEIRELLKMKIMEQEGDDGLIQNLIHMEAKLAFAGTPVVLPAFGKEQELIGRLNKKLFSAGKTGWFLGGIASVAILTGTYLMMPKEQASVKPPSALSIPPPADPAMLTVADTVIPPAQERPGKAALKLPQLPVNPMEEMVPSAPIRTSVPLPPLPATVPAMPLMSPGNGVLKNGMAKVDTFFQGIKRVEISGLVCDVNIKGVESDQVTLKGEIVVETKGLVKGKGAYKINYEKKDTLLKVWIEHEGGRTVIVGSCNIGGFLNLEIPKKTDLLVKSNDGGILVDGLQGNVCDLNASYGYIRADNIKTNMNLRSSSGDISLNDITGNVKAESSYGQQEFNRIVGDLKSVSASGDLKLNTIRGNMEIKASYGNVKVAECKGDLKISAASGVVTATGVEGKTCKLSSTYGAVTAEHITAELFVDAQSGDVNILHVNGNVQVGSTYGQQVLNDIKGNLKTRSGSGDIKLTGLTGDADIKSTHGDLFATGVKGDFSADIVSGSITGKEIELRESMNVNASYGDIRIQLINNIDDLSFDLKATYGEVKVMKNGKKYEGTNGSVLVQQGKIMVKGYSASGNQMYE